MDTLAALAHGFSVALTPYNLLWAAVGVTVGTAIGVLPGIGPALTVALLLPVTYNLDPTAAFIMFVIGGLAARVYWKANNYDRIPTGGGAASYSILDDDED